MPISPNSTAEFYQNSPRFVNMDIGFTCDRQSLKFRTTSSKTCQKWKKVWMVVAQYANQGESLVLSMSLKMSWTTYPHHDHDNHHVYYQRSRPIWLHHRLQKRPVNHKNHEFFSLLNWPWTSKKGSLIKYNVSAKIRILKDLKRSKGTGRKGLFIPQGG